MNKDNIYLTIPADPKYLSLARLVLSGIVLKEDVDVEELEDLKLLITESCNLSFAQGNEEAITIEILLQDSSLSFSVSGLTERVKEEESSKLTYMIIESLSDGITFEGDRMVVSRELE